MSPEAVSYTQHWDCSKIPAGKEPAEPWDHKGLLVRKWHRSRCWDKWLRTLQAQKEHRENASEVTMHPVRCAPLLCIPKATLKGGSGRAIRSSGPKSCVRWWVQTKRFKDKTKIEQVLPQKESSISHDSDIRYRSVSGVLSPEQLFKRIPTAQENHLSVTGDGKVKLFPSFCSIFGIKWKADPCCSKQNATLLQQEGTLVFEHESDYKKHVSYDSDSSPDQISWLTITFLICTLFFQFSVFTLKRCVSFAVL